MEDRRATSLITGRLAYNNSTNSWSLRQDLAEQPKCRDCIQGEESPESGSPVCTTCLLGKYQNEEGKANCKECESGRFNAPDTKPGNELYPKDPKLLLGNGHLNIYNRLMQSMPLLLYWIFLFHSQHNPMLLFFRCYMFQLKTVAKAPMINMNRPSNHPDFENANGSDNAPAPNVAEHKLNTEPRTEPSRNHLLNASLGSAALAIFHKGVPGDHKGTSICFAISDNDLFLLWYIIGFTPFIFTSFAFTTIPLSGRTHEAVRLSTSTKYSTPSSAKKTDDNKNKKGTHHRWFSDANMVEHVSESQKSTHEAFGMLYTSFREECWWWEITVTIRKIMIVGIGVFGEGSLVFCSQ